MEQKNVADETAKMMDFYLKKHKIENVRDRLCESIAELEKAMQDEGVSYDDLKQGRATERVLDLAEQTAKYQIRFDNVSRRAVNQSHNSKEFETFKKEYEAHKAVEDKKTADAQGYKEAQERYKLNPSKENFTRLAYYSNQLPGNGAEGVVVKACEHSAEDIKRIHANMREKYAKESQEIETEEAKHWEMLAKHDDPGVKAGAEHIIKMRKNRAENEANYREIEALKEREMENDRQNII